MFFAAELTDAQLLIAALLSGGGVVAIIVRWLVTSPERESTAYTKGIVDERVRCNENLHGLRERVTEQNNKIAQLYSALLRLAVDSDLTQAQRTEIAIVLGYTTAKTALGEALEEAETNAQQEES